MPAPTRLTVHDVSVNDLCEPALTAGEQEDYARGWMLFNRREFWHAHEAWEGVWKRHPEPSRLFFEGIIQLAAAYHLLTTTQRYRGIVGNLAKAEEKLRMFAVHAPRIAPGAFLGVDVWRLLGSIEVASEQLRRLGPGCIAEFPPALIPQVTCTRVATSSE
jgi:hypothetical protein